MGSAPHQLKQHHGVEGEDAAYLTRMQCFYFLYCNLVHRDTLLSEAIQLKNTYDREDMVSVSGRSHCGCLSFMRTREAKACHLSVTSQDDKEGVSFRESCGCYSSALSKMLPVQEGW